MFFADQPYNITIHNKGTLLRAGSQHEFICEAIGSRPAAIISWGLDNKQFQASVDNILMVRKLPTADSSILHRNATLNRSPFVITYQTKTPRLKKVFLI